MGDGAAALAAAHRDTTEKGGAMSTVCVRRLWPLCVVRELQAQRPLRRSPRCSAAAPMLMAVAGGGGDEGGGQVDTHEVSHRDNTF